jgi:heat shock protein HslJ
MLCGRGGLFAQAPGPGARSGRLNFQDTEYRLSDAIVNGVQATFGAQPSPTIGFHSGGVISGSSGVNDYFAKIRVAQDGAFSLESHGFALTKLTADADRMEAEARFLNAIQSTRFIRREGDVVTFETGDHATRIQFTRTTAAQGLAELQNVELVLVRFVSNGNEIVLPANATVTLIFQDGGRISGRSAVNNYAGVFTAAPNGKIALELTVATQMAGPAEMMTLEKAYFTALSLLRDVRVNGDGVTLAGEMTSMEFKIRTPR